VLLIGPPREEREMDPRDVHLVRERLIRELRHHLAEHLEPAQIERYRTYVGSARIRHARDSALSGRT